MFFFFLNGTTLRMEKYYYLFIKQKLLFTRNREVLINYLQEILFNFLLGKVC